MFCHVVKHFFKHGKDVASTFTDNTDGKFKVTYTVADGDTVRTAGQVPLNCTLSNGSGSTTVTAFTDSNTIARSRSG